MAPASPQPQPPLELNCLVLGNSRNHIFSVKIATTESVSTLKKVIKEENQHTFQDVNTRNLVLWKVSIHVDSVSAELAAHTFDDEDDALKPLDPLSAIFPDAPTPRHVHIVIRHPQLW